MVSQGSFLPALYFREPERRVHPCQGAFLAVVLEDLDALCPPIELPIPPAALAETLGGILGRGVAGLMAAVESQGGELLDLRANELIFWFRDTLEMGESVLGAIGAALEVLRVFGLWKEGPGLPVDKFQHKDKVSLRCGIGAGICHGIILSTPGSRPAGEGLRAVFTGQALEDARRAMEAARPGQIMLHSSAGGRLDAGQVLTEPPLPTPALCQVLGWVERSTLAEVRSERRGRKVETPAPVVTRMVAVRACILTASVAGIDPALAGGMEALAQWYERSSELLKKAGGVLVSLEVGSAGRAAVMFEAIKLPSDHELRALRGALALQRVARDLPLITNQRMGLASGVALVVTLAHQGGNLTLVLGSRRVISGRLALLAGPWEILAERQTVSRSGFGFDWGPSPAAASASDLEVNTARVLYGEGAYGTRLSSRSRGSLLGREELMERLRSLAGEALQGRGRLVSLVGAPGMGKSALVVWLGHYLQTTRRVPVYRGECSALVRHAPYHAWRPVFRDWMDLQPDLPVEDQVARIAQRVESLGADLMARLPLLSMVTDVKIPENPTTESLDTRQRREALHALILTLFKRAHAQVPMSLLFEDAHWMDEASVGLLRYLARNVTNLPLFIVLTRRTEEEGQQSVLNAIEAIPGIVPMVVGAMTEDALAALACRHLGASSLSPELRALLFERSDGIPLLMEEVTLLLRDSDWITLGQDKVAHILPAMAGAVPKGLREVVLARVSRLDEGAQLTLKTASAVGRTFTLSLLQEVYPIPFDFSVLMARLDRVEGLDIVRQDGAGPSQYPERGQSAHPQGAGHEVGALPSDQLFFFKHALIRDTVYETLTAASRRSLHEAIGAALERRLKDENRTELVLAIAEHYRRTSRTDKQRQYFREAGEISRARGLNREALDYFTAAEQICQAIGQRRECGELISAQIAVLNLLGDRDRQRDAILRLKEISKELEDNSFLCVALRLEGSLLTRSGDQNRAMAALEKALATARALGDAQQIASTLRPLSRLHLLQGNLPAALETSQEALALMAAAGRNAEVDGDEANVGFILGRMNQKAAGRARMEAALERAQVRGDVGLVALILANLAIQDFEGGRLDQALRAWERSLALTRQVGVRQEEARNLANLSAAALGLGELERARDFALEARQIAVQIEHVGLEIIARNNLGSALLALNELDSAREVLREALTAALEQNMQSFALDSSQLLIQVELARGRVEEAIKLVGEARAKVPHHNGLRVFSASALWKGGRKEAAVSEAIVALEELEKDPNPGENTVVLRYNLSQVLDESDPATSIRLLQEARDEVLRRAELLEDVQDRQRMLERIPENRSVLSAWTRLELSVET